MSEEEKNREENRIPEEREESSSYKSRVSKDEKENLSVIHKGKEKEKEDNRSIFNTSNFSSFPVPFKESESTESEVKVPSYSSSAEVTSSKENIELIPFKVTDNEYIYLKVMKIIYKVAKENTSLPDSYYLKILWEENPSKFTSIQFSSFQDIINLLQPHVSTEFKDRDFEDFTEKLEKFFKRFYNGNKGKGYIAYMIKKGLNFENLFEIAEENIDENTKRGLEEKLKKATNNELCGYIIYLLKNSFSRLGYIYRSESENIKHYLKILDSSSFRYYDTFITNIKTRINLLRSLVNELDGNIDNIYDLNDVEKLKLCMRSWDQKLVYDEGPLNIFKAFHFSLSVLPSLLQALYINLDIEELKNMSRIKEALDSFENTLKQNHYEFRYYPIKTGTSSNTIHVGYFVTYDVFRDLKDCSNCAIILVVPKEINKYLNFGKEGSDKDSYYIYTNNLGFAKELYDKLRALVKEAEVIIPWFDKIIDDNIYLKDILLKPTTSPTQIQLHKQQSATSQNAMIKISGQFYKKLESSLKTPDGTPGFFSLVIASGTIIIVYDEEKKGIEDSLARIASRVAEIHGSVFNPKIISKVNSQYLQQVGVSDGIYVLKSDLCSSNTNSIDNIETMNRLIELLKGAMGTKYSIIIMPKCIYNILQLQIGGKPSLILFEDFDLPSLFTMAYMASGGSSKLIPNWDVLSNVNVEFYDLLNNTSYLLSQNYPGLQLYQQNTSMLHNLLQDYSIAYLITKRKADPNNIWVQSNLGYLIPDVFEVSNHEIYDAKASIGILPNQEVYGLANKYGDLANKVVAVMDPLAVLLNLKALISKLNYLNSNEPNAKYDVMIPFRDIKELEEKEEIHKEEGKADNEHKSGQNEEEISVEYNMLSLEDLLKLAEQYFNSKKFRIIQ
ncbi:hypothetical protein CM19_01015 [Candidatus Acidianus copahuensis]|uniref:Uncharacterized protein n=1 Tax=Candidatus Acidianus copahuensis TaxID=1160895 RepID=A0A031LV87_9CREN|nr:hypothetical protein [Candidatus Acidianus copahuensis]EZQ11409.1 hypothetical protein CM19_01015 [Candidatus Acidianus copahuensis]